MPTDHSGENSGKQLVDRIVRCPTCGGDSIYGPSNKARPFCSERCQNMDFGAWAGENFRIPAPATPDDIARRDSNLH
jgi:endogenous inhibitor of DNA gyrase (YacG/DUF329 family)